MLSRLRACGLTLSWLWLAAACASHVRRHADPAIAAAIDNAARPTADRERDASSRPRETLQFIGIAPGMTVLDMNAATGYYTELLSRVVGPRGHVIAHNHPGARLLIKHEEFDARYGPPAGSPRLPNVEQIFARHNDLHLPARSLDAVLMSMVYHDTYWYDPKVDWGPVDQAALLGELFAALKPGGVIGVVDHVAGAGTDPWFAAKAWHRIDPQAVRRDFAAAGFVLEAESPLLANADDDHTRSVFDPAIRGRTDRFMMRFRKPVRRQR